jgi:intein-encoded DNA endonuclease-like protein
MTKTVHSGNALRSVVEERLAAQGKKLPALLKSHHKAGVGVRRISNDIQDRTGVIVSYSTVWRWLKEIETPKNTAA